MASKELAREDHHHQSVTGETGDSLHDCPAYLRRSIRTVKECVNSTPLKQILGCVRTEVFRKCLSAEKTAQ